MAGVHSIPRSRSKAWSFSMHRARVGPMLGTGISISREISS
jgi:hypothetical protein